MVTEEEISSSIKEFLVKEFEIDESIISDESTLESLELDSLDIVDIIVSIQSKIGKKISANDFRQIRTLGDISRVITEIANRPEGKSSHDSKE